MPTKKSANLDNDAFRHRLSALLAGPHADALRQGLRGIERESLRVTPEGKLAMTPHPSAFGSALTHPLITTDYSEALVELITDARTDVGGHARAPRHPASLRLRETRRRTAVERLDALRTAARRRNPDRLVRHVEHRHAEARLPAWSRAALRSHDAMHRRHSLQLFAARGRLARLADARPGQHAVGRRLPVGAVLRAHPQFPPHVLAADVSVRRVAGARRGFRARQAPHARNLRRPTRCTCRTPPACA